MTKPITIKLLTNFTVELAALLPMCIILIRGKLLERGHQREELAKAMMGKICLLAANTYTTTMHNSTFEYGIHGRLHQGSLASGQMTPWFDITLFNSNLA